MKKWMILLAGTLVASSVLVACGQKKDQPTSPSSSSKVSLTSSASSKKSETSKSSTELSTETSSSDTSISSSQENSQEPSEPATKESSAKSEIKGEKEPAATSSLDMQAIASGDFSSMAGTWRDANGVTYTFDAKGLVSDVAKLELTYAGLDENGIYRTNIRWHNLTGAALSIIPAGKKLPAGETVSGQDPTDSSRDRFIIAQGISEHPDVFYRVK
ncbi:DUF6287 domain-containing protein [Streptococcus cristatus]|uniref:DUF6287 domain-containing protein n=1 Tax=Streptococcus cristatus TaxID=45634 RepID=UPI002880409E|nr:DUF6287 domain-containing protein [Streptococcus cristatus]